LKKSGSYLESFCQSSGSHRWGRLCSSGGNLLERTFLCIRAAKVGALLPIREIGPDGRSWIGFPLLLTVGGVSSTYLKKRKSELPIGIKED